ncbi:myosin-like protein [Plasmopara halstedii]|uniref:Myosin-like protein n=1 Tax=Plasmopara halstedii TaxID=4781 RepID=A0A0P1AKQ5_PLAHL|nr:myosin-like protein [Plasmopara halstedii]CEG41854.1 myosin-like protein [Plasmopara halstedii]|eukprot:XP_024578223.1 myosin-like protein [Plasmopara halstedii]
MLSRRSPPTTSTRPPSSKSLGKSVESPSNNQQNSNNATNLERSAHFGQIDAKLLQVGTKVWVADSMVLWRIGEVQSIGEDRKTAQVYLPDAADDQVQTLRMDQLYTFDASHIVDHSDVALMNNLHEAPLLNVLRQRFERDEIYTFTADILLSINPYKSIPLLYDVVGFMTNREVAISSGDGESSAPPHLFAIAEKAYTGMKGVVPGTGSPQSIVISGESGAGKTEASKYIMKYLATASKHVASGSTGKNLTGVHDQIEECVVLSNLILESFGNAKTSRNDNSSRFGKYIQIHYNHEGRMAGVSIRHFLLEKTRLVRPETNERNYHIFYQLLAGIDQLPDLSISARPLLLQHNAWNYTYLTRGDCIKIDGVNDAIEFEQLRHCLEQLGMDYTSFQRPMFELLAAILHLGNVTFEKVATEDESDQTQIVFPESDIGVHLEHVSMLLGVDAKEFATKMITQTTVTGRGSILELKLTPDQAKNAMDAFCKYLFGELFDYVITRINACAKQQTSDSVANHDKKVPIRHEMVPTLSVSPFIGILDIFGFEVMKRNSLEQLCINFTNETLQQQFNKHVFVLEQERYAREGIAVSPVEFQDNQRCLDLIQKPPLGLLPLLEEQMLLKRKTTDKQLLTIYHSHHLDKHSSYAKPRFECDEFIIRHYAGDVTYDIHDFIAKNTENLHDDLLDLLRQSSQPLLQAMLRTPTASALNDAIIKRGPSTPTNNNHKRAQSTSLTGTTTVSSRFRTQLGDLMDVLWHTTPSYIKCIKPNNLKFPRGFSCELVRDQLVYSGVLEVVRIRQEGFPIRKIFSVFFELFWPLAIATFRVADTRNNAIRTREACETIARNWLKEKDAENEMMQCNESPELKKGAGISTRQTFAMGKHEIFLRYGQIERLEGSLATLRHDSLVLIQAKVVRARLAYKKFHRLRHATVKWQAQLRMHLQRRNYLQQRKATVIIQARFRAFHFSRLWYLKKCAAILLTRKCRQFLVRCQFLRLIKWTRAATEVQRHIRGFLLRTAAERERKLRDRSTLQLQSWHRMVKHRRRFLLQRFAAVQVQTIIRSRIIRRRFLRDKNAAIIVAAFARQVIQLRRFKRLKANIVKTQALARKYAKRRMFVALRSAVVSLQSVRRRHAARRMMDVRKAAVQCLQQAMVGWIARRRFVKLKRSTRRVQASVTTWLLCRHFRLIRKASRRIQKMWRTYIQRVAWQLEVARVFKGTESDKHLTTSWTQHSRMEDSDYRMAKLRLQPEIFFMLQPRTFGYNSLFHKAAACGDFYVVKYMLTKCASNHLLTLKNGRGFTAFHEACAFGQYAMVKYLALQYIAIIDLPEQLKTEDPEKDENSTTDEMNNQEEREPEVKRTNVYSGYLRKRRETSRWMRRYVVLSVESDTFDRPQLDYFPNDRQATLSSQSSRQIDLTTALLKTSIDLPFAFELHSPQLLGGRNKEGRLYFAASDALEIQCWLAHLRNIIPSSIESRVFAMHRSAQGNQLEFIDFQARQKVCNFQTFSPRLESPLHLVASCSNFDVLAPIKDEDCDNNQSSSSEIQLDVSIPDIYRSLKSKCPLNAELELVKTTQWLLENGADINALTAHHESPLQLALQAGHLTLSKVLLDRGALASGLSEPHLMLVRSLKAELAKTAITSISSSSTTSLGPQTPKKMNGLMAAGSALLKRPRRMDEFPLLFLFKQPGKVLNSLYVSLFVELIGLGSAPSLGTRGPRIVVSVMDREQNLVEMQQQVSVQPVAASNALLWGFTWHMQTPLENLPHGACVVIELASTARSCASPTCESVTSPTLGASVLVPECWTYVQVDQRTANSAPITSEIST